jgi:nicotinate-nucleotide adenylyltransferase
VFGGTFDPPHIGHLVAAVNARHALSLDTVLLVVANDPWQKHGERRVSPAADRLALAQAAVEGLDGLEASDLEIARGGPSYTADTLADLHAASPAAELFVILGHDAAVGLPTWERVDEVVGAASFVVVDRPGTERDALPDLVTWRRVEMPRLDLSSSELRRRFADGRPVDLLLPDAVVSRIRRLGLYGGRPQ